MFNKNLNGVINVSPTYETLKTKGTTTATPENEFGIKIKDLVALCKANNVTPVLRIKSTTIKRVHDFRVVGFQPTDGGYRFMLVSVANTGLTTLILLILDAYTATKTYETRFNEIKPVTPPSNLSDLSDVTIQAIQQNQVLKIDPNTFQWVNGGSAVVFDIDDMSPNFNLDSGGIVPLLYNLIKIALNTSECPVIFTNLKLDINEEAKTFQPLISLDATTEIIYVTINDNGMLYNATITHGVDNEDTFELQTVTPVIDSQLPQNGDVLAYNSTTGRYVNKSLAREQVSVVADGVKSYADLLDELAQLVDTSKVTPESYLMIAGYWLYKMSLYGSGAYEFASPLFDLTNIVLDQRIVYLATTGSTLVSFVIAPASTSYTDLSAQVPTSGNYITIVY